GITFGPVLDGRPSIILVSDNNFSPAQFTQFIALSQVGAIPEPETYALMLAGLGLVLAARRRLR
ncbi:MAG: PEP-CTERM sorting domain-containing protein, partial [Burkholderiales bacterium]